MGSRFFSVQYYIALGFYKHKWYSRTCVYPRTTQTIEIQSFVDASEIPFVYLERPYYTAPINKGAKVYALLRDTLAKTGKIGDGKSVTENRWRNGVDPLVETAKNSDSCGWLLRALQLQG